MNKENRKYFYVSVCLLVAVALWTAAVCLIDVQPIGPQGSTVGFASVNQFVHALTGVHMSLYTITDWLELVPFGFAASFALLGLMQWIRRKHLLKVDRNILVLGVFYVVVAAVYVLFEHFPVNYRPILINGLPETSYPSSTTLLVMCVMPTSALQMEGRIRNTLLRRCITLIISAFTVFMVIGRLVSGVHWFSDIIGSILLSAGLVLMYYSLSDWNAK